MERRTPDESCDVAGIVKWGTGRLSASSRCSAASRPRAGWKSIELLKKTMRRLKAAIAALD
jgi:hypothetical protein